MSQLAKPHLYFTKYKKPLGSRDYILILWFPKTFCWLKFDFYIFKFKTKIKKRSGFRFSVHSENEKIRFAVLDWEPNPCCEVTEKRNTVDPDWPTLKSKAELPILTWRRRPTEPLQRSHNKQRGRIALLEAPNSSLKFWPKLSLECVLFVGLIFSLSILFYFSS